jgi:hypothetical protein
MGKLREADVGAWFMAGKPIAGRSYGNGLTFTLSSKGLACWVLRCRFGGRMRELTLARYPERNLEAARKLARKERVLINQGLDPQAKRRKEKLALSRAKSFEALSADYMLRATPDLAETTRDEARRYLRNAEIIYRGGAKPLSCVRRS